MFKQHGIPDDFQYDNNSFNDYKFKEFERKYGFKHVPSSQKYPQSNELSETGEAIAKNIVKRSSSDEEISLGLMEYRNSSLKLIGYSPMEIMTSRSMKTLVRCSSASLSPKHIDHELNVY